MAISISVHLQMENLSERDIRAQKSVFTMYLIYCLGCLAEERTSQLKQLYPLVVVDTEID